MKLNVPYKPKSNIISSLSIRQKDEADFIALCDMLKAAGVSKGEYLNDCYRELDKGNPDWMRLKQIRYSR
tara:strand:- start:344 stop:553 length:210 start_codon:yes stop_codon:yes gene_type:complete